jgi:HD superfamily phosphodiesterase
VGKVEMDIPKNITNEELLVHLRGVWRSHPKLGVPIAETILSELNYSKDFIKDVCYLVENHSNFGLNDKSMELKIVQDADLIADIGIAGFIRPFLFAGQNKRSTIDTIEYSKNNHRFSDKEKLNLDISKEIAQREFAIQLKLTEQIYQTINSDIRNT